MEVIGIKEYYKGCKVHRKGNPNATGVIEDIAHVRAIVIWDDKTESIEDIFDLVPILTPKQKAGRLIAHWNVKENGKDLAAVRSIVDAAIADCGLDATATVEIDKENNIPSLGHYPYKATIKINGTYPAVRMANGTLVKDMDTITVTFRKQVGLYDFNAYHERNKTRDNLLETMPQAEAMAAVDALPWDGEVVDFSARTNGRARDYRKRYWYPFEGGVAGYGAGHIGGHFGYAESWESLKEDFAAYVRKVANDLGYAGKVWRKAVA
jgi:hypothetical protein